MIDYTQWFDISDDKKIFTRKNYFEQGYLVTLSGEMLDFYCSVPAFPGFLNGAVDLFGLPISNETKLADDLYEQTFISATVHKQIQSDGTIRVYLPHIEAVYKRYGNSRRLIKDLDGAYKEISRIAKDRDTWMYEARVLKHQLELILKQPASQVLAQIKALVIGLPDNGGMS